MEALLKSGLIEQNRNKTQLVQGLEAKNAHLKKALQEEKRKAKERERELLSEADETSLRLAGAIDTINALKKTLSDCTAELAFVHALREDLEKRLSELTEVHKDALKSFECAVHDVIKLKEVNTRLVAEIKRLNTQLNE